MLVVKGVEQRDVFAVSVDARIGRSKIDLNFLAEKRAIRGRTFLPMQSRSSSYPDENVQFEQISGRFHVTRGVTRLWDHFTLI